MIKEFLHPKGFSLGEGKERVGKREALRVMDHPELSLGPSFSFEEESPNSSSSSEYDTGGHCRKRKHTWDELITAQSGIELQLNHPLPLDWEQCLDLQSGRMYYLNKKTLKKSWLRPKERKLNLELNISALPPSSEAKIRAATTPHDSKKHIDPIGSMVAVACANCHLLVMLCTSSPSCPNCKFVHTLPPPRTRPLETLSLLH